MANRRVSLIWGGAEQQPGEWRLGLWGRHERNPGSRILDISISVRGILRWLGALAVAAYLAGASALFVWLDRRPSNRVTFTDTLLLPLRWQAIQEKRGLGYIAEGLEDLRARRWADAHMKLRAGLAKYPRDLRARMALAQFYSASDRRLAALALLREGLSFGYPGRPYLELLFRLATEGEDFGMVIAACDQFLPAKNGDYGWLLTQKLDALNSDRQSEVALQLAAAHGVGTALVNEARVVALLNLRRVREAVEFLDDWQRAAPNLRETIVRLRVRACREAGDLTGMEASLEEMRSLAPSDPRPYAYTVVQRSLAGREREAGEALERFFLRFGAAPENLQILAEPLAEAGSVDLLLRLLGEAQAHGFSPKPYLSALVLLHLNRGEVAPISRLLEKLAPLVPLGSASERFWMEWVGQLTSAANSPEDAEAVGLLGLLRSRPLPLKTFRLSAAVLMKVSRAEAARAVLRVAGANYPASQTLARLATDVDAALAARAPKAAAAVSLHAAVPTERVFFERLSALEKAGRWSDAAQSLRSIRVAKPEWLAARMADVLHAQMRIAVETRDTLELLGAAKMYLDGTNERSAKVVEVARVLGGRGAQGDGMLLLGEVFRRSADFPPARRLRDEWEAAAQAADEKK